METIGERIGKSELVLDSSAGNEFAALEKGVEFTLEICADPGIQQIVFRDAPAIIGQREWREIEIKYALGLMQNMLAALAAKGIITSRNTEMLAQIILGAIIEAAHAVALSKDQETALTEATTTVLSMVRALKHKN